MIADNLNDNAAEALLSGNILLPVIIATLVTFSTLLLAADLIH